jgi:hypothetical protein
MFCRKIFMVTAALLIVLSSVTYSDASSWTRLKSDNKDKVCYINIADLKLRGAMATYWYRTENSSQRSSKIRGAINCATNESLIMKVIHYGADGRIRFSTRVASPEWKEITPGSLMSRHRDVLCEGDAVRSRKDFGILTGIDRSDWVTLGPQDKENVEESDNGQKRYLNLKNVTVKEDIVTCWNKFSNPDNSFTLSKLVLNCHEGKLKKLDLIEFNSDGEPVWDTSDSDWEGASSAPEIGLLLDELCPKDAATENAGEE